MRRIVLAAEYVPQYRVAFYERLVALGAAHDVEVVVAAGEPAGAQALRLDSAAWPGVEKLRQREFKLLGRRFVVRRLGRVIVGADLVIVDQARRNLDAYRLLLPRVFRRGPLALWGHGRDFIKPASALDDHLLRLLTRRADWFFGYTDRSVELAVESGLPRSRTSVVFNTVDTTALARDLAGIEPAEVEGFRRDLDLPGPVALFMGGLDDSKRIPFLLEAADRVARRNAAFRLIIAGDGAHRNRVVDELAARPWLRHVGMISGHKKAVALTAADVIAMPGRVGLIAVESFAAGTPIVSTNWPFHAPEFDYLDGSCAVITEDSVESYAEGLEMLLRDSARLARLSARCAERALEFDIAGMAERFFAGVLNALGRPASTVTRSETSR